MTEWVQFSVWDEKWPRRAITDFLPALREIIGPMKRWHFLYEPYLLVRVNEMYQSSAFNLWEQVQALATTLGYRVMPGDKSLSAPGGCGFFYEGEAKFYGSQELWEANANILWATSELMIRLQQEGKLNFKMLRKHTHLFANASGKNYIESSWFWMKCAVQDFLLFLKYGFN